jgi:putative transposase
MPRPPRIDFADALYHVTSRGNGRATIFHDDADCERFLAQLAQHLRLADVHLLAYVLMGNHFHLLVRTPRANLSRFMQRLLSSYALYSRYKHRRPGHLFQGRFKAKLIEDESYLLAVSRYIHLNPVKTAATRRWSAAQRLRHLESYRWSSYRGHVSKADVQEFMRYDVLKEYGRDPAAARRRYRAYVHACLTEDDGPLLDALAANRYSIGSESFVEKTDERIERRRTGGIQDHDLDLPRRVVALDDIDAAVARHFKIEEQRLSQHGHRAGPAKAVAVELAVRLADLSGRAVGGHYRISSTGVGAIHRRMAERPEMLAIADKIERTLQKHRRK